MAKAKKITYTQQGYQQLVDELQYIVSACFLMLSPYS